MAEEDDITDIEEICYQIEKLAEHYAEIEETIVEFDPESKIDMDHYNKVLERLNFVVSETERRCAKVKKYCRYVTEDKLELMMKEGITESSSSSSSSTQASSSNQVVQPSSSSSSTTTASSSSSDVSNSIAPPAIIAKAMAKKQAGK